MRTITMELGPDSYDIIIRKGCLSDAGELLDLDRKVLVVSDDKVPSVYAQTVLSQCAQGYLFTFEGGERNKNLSTLEKILMSLLEHNFSRKDCIVAVGGGITGDMSGFAASTYMRGIDFYNIPTTLLSQVDSSIGGKTAVNLSSVKNIVGSFYQPKRVLIDTDVLRTLDQRQLVNGMVEALKMAFTCNSELFDVFVQGRAFEDLEYIIEQSLLIKKNVVEQDVRENGLRKVLNFGHTIGHGIEGSFLDDTLYHGECVALGMIAMTSKELRSTLTGALEKIKSPTHYPFDKARALEILSHDKKGSNGMISTVQVSEIGSFELVPMTTEQIAGLLDTIAY